MLDDLRSVALGNEPVRDADETVVGRVSSGGLGYSLERSIAYAWLPAAHAEVGTRLSVEVFGEIVVARSPPSRCSTQQATASAPDPTPPPTPIS